MVQTRSMATSPGHQESGNASSHPNHAHNSTPVVQPPSVQQMQSMAKLTRQNQELTREINQRRQRHERCVEGQAQSQEVREGENVERENHLKCTASHRMPHLEKEMDQIRKSMDKMRENMRRMNHVDDLVPRTDSPFIASINSHPLPSKFKMPALDLYDGMRDPHDHIATFKTTMHLQGVPDEIMCKAFQPPLRN